MVQWCCLNWFGRGLGGQNITCGAAKKRRWPAERERAFQKSIPSLQQKELSPQRRYMLYLFVLLLAGPPALAAIAVLGLIAALAASAWWHLGPAAVPGIVRALLELLSMLIEIKVHGLVRGGTVWSFVDLVEARVDVSPGCVQFIQAETGQETTLAAVEKLANQVANWGAHKIGLPQHSSVCLMMQNNCQYVSVWLGMGKIGVGTALLNTNIAGTPLVHSVEVALRDTTKKVMIVDSELAQALSVELADLKGRGVSVYLWDDLCDAVSGGVGTASPARPPRKLRNMVNESDPLLFIFTSGTTGLPKAARISSTRLLMMTMPARTMGYLKEGHSRMYCCLPLYHSAGGMLGAGSALASGCTLVIRKKFSASNFSSDCVRHRCNSAQYIGELCRYLMLAPPSPADSQLDLQYIFGNGMRQEVWKPFMDRYGVSRVVEFYSATEANVGLFNSTGQVGALGCVPRLLDFLYPVLILRVDPEHRDTPLRSKNGLCILADVGETGLVVCKITSSPLGRFEGYSDKAATGKKILVDVVESGDRYFNSGDLLHRDAFGFFYWADRVGDTFRWKGENVATTEVEHVLAPLPFVSDLCVYGVEVPNYDGRCGMVAISLAGMEGRSVDDVLATVDWGLYHQECVTHLPMYARPRFIRVSGTALQTTGTFKHQKNVQIKAGYSAEALKEGERLFFYFPKSGKVLPLDPKLHRDIEEGSVKL